MFNVSDEWKDKELCHMATLKMANIPTNTEKLHQRFYKSWAPNTAADLLFNPNPRDIRFCSVSHIP